MRRKTPEIGEAISPERIEALFAPLARARGILLAVSGGPDSTALLIMAARWAQLGARPKIEVATVDHAMREGSREEAEAVAALAQRFGLSHRLIDWRGVKPRSRIQERAREARYQLLSACAQEIGADFLVTAHHADDQAETVLFRLFRGSGIGGLKGMEGATTAGGLTLARPLLGLRKAQLVAFCEACGETYANDPSNVDPRFARTHLRRLVDLLASEGFGVDEIARLSRRAARMEEVVAIQAQEAAERLGWTRTRESRDATALFEQPLEIAQRLLRNEIARVAGKQVRQVRLDRVEALANALQGAQTENRAMRANVGGASVRLSSKGVLTFSPEALRKGRIAP